MRVLLVDLALAARELAAELTAVLALAMLSVSPSSAPILSPLTHETVAVEGTDRLSSMSEGGSAKKKS